MCSSTFCSLGLLNSGYMFLLTKPCTETLVYRGWIVYFSTDIVQFNSVGQVLKYSTSVVVTTSMCLLNIEPKINSYTLRIELRVWISSSYSTGARDLWQ